MVQRKCRESFTHEDEERLLAFMEVTREMSIRYGSAHDYHSKQNELHMALNVAIDKLGEHITGDPKLFLPDGYGIGRPSEPASQKRVRQLLWKELRRRYI